MLPFFKLTVEAAKPIQILKKQSNTYIKIRQISGSSVSEFYNGRSVLLTGGTGFLGQVFVEKMLYSCEGLDKLYILVRQKNGEPVETRIQELIKSPVFNRIKEINPKALSKLVPVKGDISEPNLGIKPEDEAIIKDKVTVVVNSAANVKFNAPLSEMMCLNFEGTRRVVELCHKIKKLDVFAHVSTAYSQTNIPVLEEKIYPAPKSYEEVQKFIEEHGHDTKKTMKFIGSRPNTYVFSKAMTENYVATQMGNISTVILRPSGDVSPVDYVSNLVIVAAAKGCRPGSVPVYNSSTSDCNPTTSWKITKSFVEQSIENKHYEKYPHVEAVASYSDMKTKFLLTYEIPAYLEDAALRLQNKKPRHLDSIKKIYSRLSVYSYFASNSWHFKSDKTRELNALLSEDDQKMFPFDPTDINWPEYFKISYDGVMKYLENY